MGKALTTKLGTCSIRVYLMAVIHLSKTDNKIYGQEGMCVN